jgi:hypothetical protein
MAMISKYKNRNSKSSNELGETFKREALSLTLEDIEALQELHGISNVDIEQHLRISLSVLSRWKNKKTELPDYYKISLYAFFKYLEREGKSKKI